MITARNQPPLPLELRPERPARLSQTWLSHFQRCKHSAYLYSKYRGATTSPVMERGSLFHEVVARLTSEALDQGWDRIPHEVAKAALFEVYAEGKFTVPATEWDHVRRCVFNWAENTVLEPDKILGVEQLVVLDLGDWRVSGKLDLCWQDEQTVGIRDYKTSPHPLTKEEFEQSFQTKVYSLLLAYGKPVTVERCPERCSPMPVCETCGGRAYIETLEPYALGEGAQHFDIAEVYPALVFDDGGLMERRRVMSRAELLDERSMLEALLEQVTVAFDTGEWPAVPSDDACGKCPCRRDCPLPDQLLPFTAIETPEEAEHYALAMDILDRERKDVVKALKAYIKNGKGEPRPIPLGNGLQLNFVKVEVNETDYSAYQEAVSSGQPVSLDDYRGKRIQTSFKPEPVPEVEMTADERWGETMPDDGPSAPHGGPEAVQTELSNAQNGEQAA